MAADVIELFRCRVACDTPVESGDTPYDWWMTVCERSDRPSRFGLMVCDFRGCDELLLASNGCWTWLHKWDGVCLLRRSTSFIYNWPKLFVVSLTCKLQDLTLIALVWWECSAVICWWKNTLTSVGWQTPSAGPVHWDELLRAPSPFRSTSRSQVPIIIIGSVQNKTKQTHPTRTRIELVLPNKFTLFCM